LVVHHPDAVGPAGGGAAAAWGVTWAGPRRRPARLLLSRRSPIPSGRTGRSCRVAKK